MTPPCPEWSGGGSVPTRPPGHHEIYIHPGSAPKLIRLMIGSPFTGHSTVSIVQHGGALAPNPLDASRVPEISYSRGFTVTGCRTGTSAWLPRRDGRGPSRKGVTMTSPARVGRDLSARSAPAVALARAGVVAVPVATDSRQLSRGGVLDEVGVAVPSYATVKRHLPTDARHATADGLEQRPTSTSIPTLPTA